MITTHLSFRRRTNLTSCYYAVSVQFTDGYSQYDIADFLWILNRGNGYAKLQFITLKYIVTDFWIACKILIKNTVVMAIQTVRVSVESRDEVCAFSSNFFGTFYSSCHGIKHGTCCYANGGTNRQVIVIEQYQRRFMCMSKVGSFSPQWPNG